MITWIHFTVLLLVCVINTSGDRPRYSEIKVSMEQASLVTKDEVCKNAHIEVWVSPEVNKDICRRLLITWWIPKVEPGDMIALYVTNPHTNFTPPIFTLTPYTATGWSHTTFQEAYLDYLDVFTPMCLGYWVIYWREHTKIASSCLQTNPSWMSDYRQLIGHLKLIELFLPGTHNSAAYSVTYRPHKQSIFEKYVYTQGESVLSQLINGIRYLDLRVGFHKDVFFAHHDFVKLRHFQGVIDDVKQFLENSNDIIIMDIHRFPVGFVNEVIHQNFIEYLEKELSEYMATPALSWQATIEDVWKTGKQLIVAYNNAVFVNKKTHKLWGPVAQKWGDTHSLDVLRLYLESVMKRPPPEPWAAMAELTPDRWDVLLDSKGGLRSMAANTNFPITDWFRHEWNLHCNIVAVDFFRGSGIVSAAIYSNLFKAFDLCK